MSSWSSLPQTYAKRNERRPIGLDELYMSVTKIPTWLWGSVGSVALLIVTAAMGISGYALSILHDHEKRLVYIESTRFTPTNAAALVREMNGDLKVELIALGNRIAALHAELITMRRDLDKAGIGK